MGGGGKSFRAGCAIVGCGPAGAILGLLLARAGISVAVLEKHADFLRDWRGDTIHSSTLEVLDELGLLDRFLQLPHHKATAIRIYTDTGELGPDVFDAGLKHPYLAWMPQWDFLEMITSEAARWPNFRLLLRAEADGLLREDGRVSGVRFHGDDGTEHELRAALTVAADGRNSALRKAAGFVPVAFSTPMDVVAMRVPRAEGDPEDPFLRIGRGGVVFLINRTTYWQMGYVIPKGGYAELRSAGIGALRGVMSELLPFLTDRIEREIATFEDVSVLQVRVDRLRRWYAPGLLFIGDAAHAMSPIGGVGINLAVQDAVAAANLLAEPLRVAEAGGPPPGEKVLAAVQRRRMRPAAATQLLQRLIQAAVIKPSLRNDQRIVKGPLALRIARSVPPLRRRMSRTIALGVRPEHVRTPLVTPPHGLAPHGCGEPDATEARAALERPW